MTTAPALALRTSTRFVGKASGKKPNSLQVTGQVVTNFGYSVSISSDGTTAIVGAYGDDDNGSDSGSAYIYELAKGVWEETKLLASDGASG